MRWTFYGLTKFGDAIVLRGGGVSYLWTSQALRQRLSTRHGYALTQPWEWHRGPRIPPMEWFGPMYGSTPSGRTYIWIPLWTPWLLAAAGSALLWFRDRPPQPLDKCPRCRYDRRGLPADSPCPECGTAAPAPAHTPT
jgi:hypothetical protein